MESTTRATLAALSEYTSNVRPVRALAAVLGLTAAALVASMPLPWHHHTIPAAGYTVIYGIQGSNWLLVVAAIVLGVAVRCALQPPGTYVKWLLLLVSFLVTLGMYADYVDTQSRAAQVYAAAYNGPGFFVGLAGLVLLIVSTVFAWRAARY